MDIRSKTLLEQPQTVNIGVISRFRPFVKSELKGDEGAPKSSVAFHKSGVKVLVKNGVKKPVEFELSKVCNMNTEQDAIFAASAQPLVAELMKGYNCGVVVFGDNNTGKTFTALGTGTHWLQETKTDGLLPRLVRDVFDAILSSNEQLEFTIRVNCYQVTQDLQVNDLMNNVEAKPLAVEVIRPSAEETNTAVEVAIIGLLEEYVADSDELFHILNDCLQRRNKKSTLFVELTITQRDTASSPFERLSSRITLVDLNSDNNDTLNEIANGLQSPTFDGLTTDNNLRVLLYHRIFSNAVSRIVANSSPHVSCALQALETLTTAASFQKIPIEAFVNREVTQGLSSPTDLQPQADVPSDDESEGEEEGVPSQSASGEQSLYDENSRLMDKLYTMGIELEREQEKSQQALAENKSLKADMARLQASVDGLIKKAATSQNKDVSMMEVRQLKLKVAKLKEQYQQLQSTTRSLVQANKTAITETTNQLAEQYKQLARALQLKERELSAVQQERTKLLQKLKGEGAGADLTATASSDEVEKLRQELSVKSKELTELKTTYGNSKKQMLVFKDMVQKLESQYTTYKEALTNKTNEVQALKQSLETRANKLASFQTAVQKKQADLEAISARASQLEQSFYELQSQKLGLERVQDALIADLQKTESQVTEKDREIHSLQRTQFDLEQRNTDMLVQIEKLKADPETAAAAAAALGALANQYSQKSLERVTEELADAKQRLATAVTERDQQRDAVRAKQSELNGLKLEIDQLQSKSRSLQRSIDDVTAQKQALQSELADKKIEIASLSEKLLAAQNTATKLSKEKRDLETALSEREKSLHVAHESAAALKVAVAGLESELREKNKQIELLKLQSGGEASNTEIIEKLEQSGNRITELERQKEQITQDLSERISALETQKASFEALINDRNAQISDLEREVEAQRSAHKTQLSQLTLQREELEQAHREAEVQVQRLKSELEQMQTQLSAARSQSSQQQNDSDDKFESEVKRLSETVAELQRKLSAKESEVEQMRERSAQIDSGSGASTASLSTDQLAKLDVLKKENMDLQSKLQETKNEMTALRKALEAKDIEIDDYKQRTEAEISDAMQLFKNDLEAFYTKSAETQKREHEEKLKSEIAARESTIATMTATLEKQQSESDEVIRTRENVILEMVEREEKLVASFDESRATYEAKLKQLTEAHQSELSAVNAELVLLREEKQALENQIKGVKASPATAAAAAGAINTSNVDELMTGDEATLKQRIAQLAEKLRAVEVSLVDKNVLAEELTLKLREREAERDALRDKLDVLDTQADEQAEREWEEANELLKIREYEQKINNLEKELKAKDAKLRSSASYRRPPVSSTQSDSGPINEEGYEDATADITIDADAEDISSLSENSAPRELFDKVKALLALVSELKRSAAQTQQQQMKQPVSSQTTAAHSELHARDDGRRASIIKPASQPTPAAANSTATKTARPVIKRGNDAMTLLKCGYLLKEGDNVRSWKRRFFKLQGLTVGYYKSSSDIKPIKEFSIRIAQVSDAPERENKDRQFCFKVHTPGRIYFLNASSADDKRDWMTHLSNAIARAAQN